MPEGISKAEFAKRIKTKYPQYASVPDEQLVQAILAKYPEYGKSLDTTEAPKPTPPPTPQTVTPTPQTSETSKILNRMGQNFNAMADMPTEYLKDSRAKFKEAQEKGDVKGMLMAIPRSTAGLAGKLAQSYGNVSGPGILYRLAQKEPPSNLVGDAATFFMPGGEEGSITESATKGFRKPIDPLKPGPLRHSYTRAVDAYQRLGNAFSDLPIEHSEALNWAQKAKELEKHGFGIPAPINKFIEWVENQSRPSLKQVLGQAKSAIDTAGSSMPVTYQVARDFKTAIREAVPWDDFGGKNGKMFRLAKQMERSLDKSIAESLKPYGADIMYRRANAEYAKAMKWANRFSLIGYMGGKMAGYGAGTVTGHPLMMGYAGSKIGEPIAESAGRSYVGATRQSE